MKPWCEKCDSNPIVENLTLLGGLSFQLLDYSPNLNLLHVKGVPTKQVR